MSLDNDNLIWIDMEMTGLNPVKDHIIEIATVITNSNLEVVDIGPEIVIYQDDNILNNMDKWNTKYHAESGLVDRVRNSSVSLKEAEKITLNYIKKYAPHNKSPICGNSICQDRRFMAFHMPKLEKHFHYRNLDVSSLKILAQRWVPDLLKNQEKKASHRAKDDILESIKELKFYRDNFIKL